MSQDVTSPAVRNEPPINTDTWLRLATVATRSIKWGTTASNNGSSWGLATQVDFNIAHGAPSAPVFAFAWATTGTFSGPTEDAVVVSLRTLDATNIGVRTKSASGLTANFPGVTVYWVVIY